MADTDKEELKKMILEFYHSKYSKEQYETNINLYVEGDILRELYRAMEDKHVMPQGLGFPAFVQLVRHKHQEATVLKSMDGLFGF